MKDSYVVLKKLLGILSYKENNFMSDENPEAS